MHKRILPSRLEVGFYLFLSVLILILSNIQLLVNIYGTALEQNYLNVYLKDTFSTSFDTYSRRLIAPDTADFIFWLFVSLVLLSLLKAAHKAYVEISYDLDFTGNRFIHPRTFTERSFWVSTFLNFFLQLIVLTISAFMVYSLVYLVVPMSIMLARIYLVEPSAWSNLFYLGGSLLTLTLGIALCVVCVRIALLHPSLSPGNE
jgi:hypothetical protein